MSKNQNPETANGARPKERVVILQPVAIRIPNSHNVYSPSQLKPQKVLSYEEFLACYADRPKEIRVCFDEIPSLATIYEKSELVTAYGFGLDCWYIIVARENENVSSYRQMK